MGCYAKKPFPEINRTMVKSIGVGEETRRVMDAPTSFNNLPCNRIRGRLYIIRISYVGGVSATALAEDVPLVLEALERCLHRGASDARAELKDLCLREHSQGVVYSLAHDFIRSALAVHRAKPFLKIPIAAQDDAKEILDEGSVIIPTLMPSVGDFPQYVVVCFLRTFDLLLDTDVLAHHEAALVQQQQGDQTAHPSVAVIERMDAQEIADEYGDQDQRIHHVPCKGLPIACAYCLHCLRCLERFERSESGEGRSVRMRLVDIVLGVLELPPEGLVGIRKQIPVQLQDDGALERDMLVAFVDSFQHITVADDLLFVTGPRRRPILQQLPHPCVRGPDALDPVRAVGALDLRYLDQPLQLDRLLPEI